MADPEHIADILLGNPLTTQFALPSRLGQAPSATCFACGAKVEHAIVRQSTWRGDMTVCRDCLVLARQHGLSSVQLKALRMEEAEADLRMADAEDDAAMAEAPEGRPEPPVEIEEPPF